MPLTMDEISQLQTLGQERYTQAVISLFSSLRATQTQWQAMAQAVLVVSQSAEGEVVESIDRAVLESRAL